MEDCAPVAEFPVSDDLSDPRWKHFKPGAANEFVERDVGEAEITDEDELRAHHGDDVLDGPMADLANDWLDMRGLRRYGDQDLEDRALHANLLGQDEVRRRCARALEDGDVAALDELLTDVVLSDPQGVVNVLRDITRRNSVDPAESTSDDDPAPEDPPPVILPRLSSS
jgi:hypothetical protein